jgi:hypothetical protein
MLFCTILQQLSLSSKSVCILEVVNDRSGYDMPIYGVVPVSAPQEDTRTKSDYLHEFFS